MSASTPSISSAPKSTKSTPASNLKFQLQSTTATLTTVPPNSYLVHATNCFGIWGAGVALAIHDLFPSADEVYAAHCDSFRLSEDTWPRKAGLLGNVCVIPPQAGDHAAKTVKKVSDKIVGESEAVQGKEKQTDIIEHGDGHVEGIWIGNLFTSYGFGRPSKRKAGLDKNGDILMQTEMALKAFKKVVEKVEMGDLNIVEEDGMRMLKVSGDGRGKKRKRGVDDGEEKLDEAVESIGEHKDENDKGVEKSGKQKAAQGRKMDIYSPQFNSGKFGIPWGDTKKLVEEVFEGWDGNWYVLTPPN